MTIKETSIEKELDDEMDDTTEIERIDMKKNNPFSSMYISSNNTTKYDIEKCENIDTSIEELPEECKRNLNDYIGVLGFKNSGMSCYDKDIVGKPTDYKQPEVIKYFEKYLPTFVTDTAAINKLVDGEIIVPAKAMEYLVGEFFEKNDKIKACKRKKGTYLPELEDDGIILMSTEYGTFDKYKLAKELFKIDIEDIEEQFKGRESKNGGNRVSIKDCCMVNNPKIRKYMDCNPRHYPGSKLCKNFLLKECQKSFAKGAETMENMDCSIWEKDDSKVYNRQIKENCLGPFENTNTVDSKNLKIDKSFNGERPIEKTGKSGDFCVNWCVENPESCSDEDLKKICKSDYDSGEFRKTNICGCHYPDEFYDNFKNKLTDEYGIDPSKSALRKCYNPICNASEIFPVNERGSLCPPDSVINRIETFQLFPDSHKIGDIKLTRQLTYKDVFIFTAIIIGAVILAINIIALINYLRK